MSNDSEIQGWMHEMELEWLRVHALQMRSVLEVGCWKGRSTNVFLKACKGPVFAVDHFLGNRDERPYMHKEATERDISQDFLDNVRHFPNLCLLKMDSLEATRYFEKKSVEMVFLDGDHEYDAFKKDVTAWLPICKRLFCGHDYGIESIDRPLKEANLNVQRGPMGIWFCWIQGN